MLNIAVVSPRSELVEYLSVLCGDVMASACRIERFSTAQAAAPYFSRHDPDLAFIDTALEDTDAFNFILELRLRQHLCRFILIVDRGESWQLDARRAITTGITDLAFYPFSREEAASLLLSADSRAVLEENTGMRLNRTIRALRNSFMDTFLGSDSFADATIANLNAKYHVNLADGVFQVAILSFPGLTEELEFGRYQMMLDSIVADARHLLDPVCFEMIPFVRTPNTIILVANHAASRSIRHQWEGILDVVKRNIKSYCSFDIPFVIGVGKPEYDSIYLRRAFQSAQYGLRCQLLRGSNKMFFYADFRFVPYAQNEQEQKGALTTLSRYAETLDSDGVSYSIYSLMSPLTGKTDPDDISRLCNQIALTIVTALRKNTELPETSARLSEISRYLNTEQSISGLTVAISSWAQELLTYCRTTENQIAALPIRDAQQYIDRHYAEHITLENLSRRIGLSPGYFCTMFKSETGFAFSEYLTTTRIEQAKALLTGSDLSIAVISERVGYRDPRYFSRIFVKTTGVQPTAYRKLHHGK